MLRRLGYVYKKPKLVPGKANAAAQREFLEDYENLKENSDADDVVMFMDATHPQHNPVISYGWIKRGEENPVKSNTGRRRLNINGAIDVQPMHAEIRFDDTIDAVSTVVEAVKSGAIKHFFVNDAITACGRAISSPAAAVSPR